MATPRLCSIPDCGKIAKARSWCGAHWKRWYKHGDPLGGDPPIKRVHDPLCSVEGCGRRYYGLDYCKRHYDRYVRHGDPLKRLSTRPGEAIEYFYKVVVPYDGDECQTWPYCRAGKGYGRIRGRPVSRLLCEEAHGAPPTPEHEAAHSCGNGHLGCVTKRHLSWKTRAENQADRIAHGTAQRGERTGVAKLSSEDVLEIMAMKGERTAADIAQRYKIAVSTVRNIHGGARWGWLTSQIEASKSPAL